MALACTNRAATSSGTDATSYAVSVSAPADNTWLIADVGNRDDAGEDKVPTLSGGGLTWTQEAAVWTEPENLTRFVAQVGSSPGAFTLTVDFGVGNTQSRCHVHVNEISGGDVSDIFVNGNSLTASGYGATGSVALGAFGSADNRPLLTAFKRQGDDVVPEGGHTQLADTTVETERFYTGWHNASADTTPSATWTTSTNWLVIAGELKMAVVGGATAVDPFGMTGFFGA